MGHGTSKDGAAFSRGWTSARVDLLVLSTNAVVDQRLVAGEIGEVYRGGRRRRKGDKSNY